MYAHMYTYLRAHVLRTQSTSIRTMSQYLLVQKSIYAHTYLATQLYGLVEVVVADRTRVFRLVQFLKRRQLASPL